MASSLNGTGLTFSSGQALNALPVTSFNGSTGSVTYSPSTAQVLSATAGYTQNVVGSFCIGASTSASSVGSNVAGSTLGGYDSGGSIYNPSFSGTWKNLGATAYPVSNIYGFTLFVRIS